MVTTNSKGEYALYEKGKLVRFTAIKLIHKAIVPIALVPIIEQMIADAATVNVKLTVSVGIRPWNLQYQTRIKNLIDKDTKKKLIELHGEVIGKEEYEDILVNGSPKLFSPETGKPGWSNHQKGIAIDFNVSIKDANGKLIGLLPSYKWLVDNALNYGFIRTVPSERWHWEYHPEVRDKFKKVLASDLTWKTTI